MRGCPLSVQSLPGLREESYCAGGYWDWLSFAGVGGVGGLICAEAVFSERGVLLCWVLFFKSYGTF